MDHQNKYNFLIVDDEFPILKIISDILTIHPNTTKIYTANDAEKAIDIFKTNQVDIVITDILMPKLSGIDFIKKLKSISNEVHIIIVSGLNNIDMVRQAMRIGAYDYIIKPFSVDEIMFSVNRVIDRLKLLDERKRYVNSLEKGIADATEQVKKSFFDSLTSLMRILEIRDKSTADHSRNVQEYSMKLGRMLKLDDIRMERLRIGCELHDIGKIAIPDTILNKETLLTEKEYEIVKNHPVWGKNVVLPISSNNPEVLDAVYSHHERFDGRGYPLGLSGDGIPLFARIVAIADAFDSMTGFRTYKEVKTRDQALEEIRKLGGAQFDPELAKLFTQSF